MAKKGAHRTIYVYADWVGLRQSTLMGLLHSTLLTRLYTKFGNFRNQNVWILSKYRAT